MRTSQNFVFPPTFYTPRTSEISNTGVVHSNGFSRDFPRDSLELKPVGSCCFDSDDANSTHSNRRRLIGDLLVSLYLFSRETTLHGVKRITLANTVWKRMLWSLLMLLSFAALAFQLTKKFKAYFNTKGALDMDVQYFSSMVFPAVMLCNANLFRISEATKRDWKMYEVLRALYDESTSNVVTLRRFPQLREMDGEKFLRAAAHQKEDMILHCIWPDGQICSSEDFHTVITDYGVCYSINNGVRRVIMNGTETNRTDPFSATNTGVGYGLYLLLNVEDYEAMAGPQRTVGVKVLIYDQNTTPAVSEQGFDVAPGFQTSVGLKKTRIEKLRKEEGGQCGYAPLRLFKQNYTRRVCALDQKYSAAANQCECLSYNMPRDQSTLPPCSVIKYFTCMLRAMQRAPDIDESKCPQDCNATEYQQYQSFSQLSPININSLLTDKQRNDMEDHYLSAREARSRNDLTEAQIDQQLIDRLLTVYDEFENRSFSPRDNAVDSVMPRLKNISCYNEYLQPLTVRNGFCLEEDLDSIVMKPLEKLLLPGVVEQGHALVRQLNQSQSVCHSIGEDVWRHFITPRVSSLISSVIPISPSSTTSASDDATSQISILVKQNLLVENSKTAIKHLIMNLDASIRDFTKATSFVDGHMAYTQNITSLNQFNQSHLLREFLTNTSQCLANLTKFVPPATDMDYEKVRTQPASIKADLYKCTQTAQECMRLALNFTKMFMKYQELVETYKTNHTVIVDELKQTCKKLDGIRSLDDVPQIIRKQGSIEYEQLKIHMLQFKDRIQTKAVFAKHVLDIASMFYFPDSVKNYFDDVSGYSSKVQKAFSEAEPGIGNLIKFYESTRYTEIMDVAFPNSMYKSFDNSARNRLLNANSCLPHVDELSRTVINMADQSAQSFLQHFHALRDHLQKYNASLKLDEHFHRNNLLALKIYLRDKSVEVLKQRESYDFWSLVCDIGGTLGLFLGASLLTVGEIIEYVFSQCAYIFQAKYRAKKARGKTDDSCPASQIHCQSNGRTRNWPSDTGTSPEMNLLLRPYTDLGSSATQTTGVWIEENQRTVFHSPSLNDSAGFALAASRQPMVIVTERPWSRPPSITLEV